MQLRIKAVLKLDWHYVGRVRGHKYYAQHIDKWQKIADLVDVATTTPKHLGEVSFTKAHAFVTQLYVVKHQLKGRHAFNSSGHIRKDSNSKRQSKAGREPLCIVTSLKHTSHSPNKIIQMYQDRMQIEEGIRDLKSTKYGFGFEHMMSYKPKRIQVLLLIAQIAAFIAYVVGSIAENQHKHYQFQANSIKHRRVLSLFYLGRRLLKKCLYQPPQTNQMLKNNHNILTMELL
jgi:transposase